MVFSSWKDFYPYAIQACKGSSTALMPDQPECIEARERSITVPEGTTPFEYSYKFKFKREGTDVQESFVLTEQTTETEEGEINWN